MYGYGMVWLLSMLGNPTYLFPRRHTPPGSAQYYPENKDANFRIAEPKVTLTPLSGDLRHKNSPANSTFFTQEQRSPRKQGAEVVPI